jgi:hypothetical protein
MDVPSLGTEWDGGRGLLHDFCSICCLEIFEIQIGRSRFGVTDQYSNRAPFMKCQIVIKESLVTLGQEADGGTISCVIWFWIYWRCWCNISQYG